MRDGESSKTSYTMEMVVTSVAYFWSVVCGEEDDAKCVLSLGHC